MSAKRFSEMTDAEVRELATPIPLRYEDRGKRLADVLAELAAARDLIAAIVQCAEVPTPAAGQKNEQAYEFTKLDRLAAIKVYSRMALDFGDYGASAKLMIETATKPLTYPVYEEPA